MKTGYFVAYFLSVVTLFMFTSGDLYYSGELKTDSGKIRILSYNIRNGIGMDEVPDYDRIAHAIRRIDPDCVALQELDSATERSQGKVVLDELAKRLGMYASYGSSIDYQGGKYGIGILSKEKALRKETVPLPGSEEKRSLLVVELPGYVMCCTHWSLTPSDRLSSIDIINKVTEKYTTKPVFLAADFPTPGSPISTGLFFFRRLNICAIRSISLSRPTTGSSRFSIAARVISVPKLSKTGVSDADLPCEPL